MQINVKIEIKSNWTLRRRVLAWIAETICFVAVCSSSVAHAVAGVNYLDPNLSGRKDEISRASLNCSPVRTILEQFKSCLLANGVTEPSEQKDALEQARNMSSDVSINSPSLIQVRDASEDVTAEDQLRAPASTKTKMAH